MNISELKIDIGPMISQFQKSLVEPAQEIAVRLATEIQMAAPEFISLRIGSRVGDQSRSFTIIVESLERKLFTVTTESDESKRLARVFIRFQTEGGERVRYGDAGNVTTFAEWDQLAAEIWRDAI